LSGELIYLSGWFYENIEKLTQLNFITRRYEITSIELFQRKKNQRRNKDGTIINSPVLDQGDNWTRLENELNKWIRELRREED
tara:strand:+ start:106 stop:354 length:249 start_codon:yes stop_codon:yes gene_type:complete